MARILGTAIVGLNAEISEILCRATISFGRLLPLSKLSA